MDGKALPRPEMKLRSLDGPDPPSWRKETRRAGKREHQIQTPAQEPLVQCWAMEQTWAMEEHSPEPEAQPDRGKPPNARRE